jgi:putative tricarboxylic transport membrane protein
VLAIFIGLLLANIILLGVGLFGVRFFVPIARVPSGFLGPFVCLLLMVGVYAFDNSFSHVVMLICLAGFAFMLSKFGISTLPIILGFVMGPIIENNLGRALIIERGNLWDVVTTPIAGSLLVISVVTAVLSYIRAVRTERQSTQEQKDGTQEGM